MGQRATRAGGGLKLVVSELRGHGRRILPPVLRCVYPSLAATQHCMWVALYTAPRRRSHKRNKHVAHLAPVLSITAVETAAGTDDAVLRLHRARSLRCTYTASTLTSFKPEREITTDHDEIIVVYDNINIERGTARVIYEKGI